MLIAGICRLYPSTEKEQIINISSHVAEENGLKVEQRTN